MIRALITGVLLAAAVAQGQSVTATQKTKDELLNSFRDGQGRNSITPRAMRDFVESIYAAASTENVFSVKQYGAIGDGETDDLAALNDTYSALPTMMVGSAVLEDGSQQKSGIIVLDPGTYVISDTWKIGPNVTVRCASSRYKCKIKFADGAAPGPGEKFAVQILRGTNESSLPSALFTHNVRLEGIEIDGNKANNPASSGLLMYFAQTSTTSNVLVENCSKRGIVVGGTNGGSTTGLLQSITIGGIDEGPGLTITDGSRSIQISNLSIGDVNIDGAELDSDGDPRPAVLISNAFAIGIHGFWSESNYLPIKIDEGSKGVFIEGARFERGGALAAAERAVLVRDISEEIVIPTAEIWKFTNFIEDYSEDPIQGYAARNITVTASDSDFVYRSYYQRVRFGDVGLVRTGTNAVTVDDGLGGDANLVVKTISADQFASTMIPSADATYDIGSYPSNRVRSAYLSQSLEFSAAGFAHWAGRAYVKSSSFDNVSLTDGNDADTVNLKTFSYTLSTGVAHAGLGAYSWMANGSLLFCTDCKNSLDDAVAVGSAAASGGNGAIIAKVNGSWRTIN